MLRERKGENFYWFVVSRQVSFKGDLVTVSWLAGTESKEHWFYQVYLRCCFTSTIKSLFSMREYYGPFLRSSVSYIYLETKCYASPVTGKHMNEYVTLYSLLNNVTL